MTNMRKILLAALAAVTLAGSVSVSTPADAWVRYGRGWGPGWGHYGWAGGWRPGWGYNRWGYNSGWGYGGAAAAGLLGGLALGAAAASPWNYGYYGSAYPGYGVYGSAYPSYGYGYRCGCW